MSDTDKKVSILPEVPKSVDNAIENLTDLPTKGIGQTLSDCWYLAFGGISQLAEKRRIKYSIELQKFKSDLETSINAVPEENRKEPSSQIVLKALEEAKYCVEENDLRELFIKLITSSTDNRKNVHPSFAHIIGQMSANDAKMIKVFKSKTEYPICDLNHLVNKNGDFYVIAQNIFVDGPDSLTQDEQSASISSLLHLGLVEIPWGNFYTSDDIYSKFKTSNTYIKAIGKYPESELDFEKKIIKITSLGRLFISCCVPNGI